MALEQVLAGIITNGEVFHNFIHGGPDAKVITEGGDVPSIANVAKKAGIVLTASLQATSNTSAVVEVGVKAFTVEANKGFQPGQWVTIARGDINMVATVVSYVGTTLNVNVIYLRGSGTFNTWTIAVSGPRGATGKTNYELAQDAGFTGTVTEYLASLKGKDGKDGAGSTAPTAPLQVLITKMPWEA